MSFAEPYTKKARLGFSALKRGVGVPPSRLSSPFDRGVVETPQLERRGDARQKRRPTTGTAGFCLGEITAPGTVISGTAAGDEEVQDFHFSTVN